MKKFLRTLPALLGLALLVACSGNKEQTTDQSTTIYAYDANSSTLEWTAFKYESKAPVKGTFKEISVSSLNNATDVKTLCESLTFSIPVSSIATQDESRDAKIIEFFFGTMSTKELTGKIVKLSEDGTAELEVTMNGITDIVKGDYTLDGLHFDFSATMDIAKWSAQEAIDVLNENCKANHTENGVTKVWTEVDLAFSTDFVESK
ncbi:MAG: YceI family protein [Crocinitomicaceae bacterium]|nr:YceI family protein [Crocinitomicaceae bacterium]